jgi:hypothetical protein
VIALLHDVVEDTFDTYCQINRWISRPSLGNTSQSEWALTRRVPEMLYRRVDPGGGEWKIATEQEVYLGDYIPRVCEFSASREIRLHRSIGISFTRLWRN